MNSRTRIPAEPFLAWCERQLVLIANGGALGTVPVGGFGQTSDREARRRAHGVLAGRLGVEVRTLWRYLHRLDTEGRPTTTLSRYSVEDMLNRAGEDFYAVYAQLEHERDIELEPDVFCPRCGEMTTPHEGTCLWCGRRVVRPATKRPSGPRGVPRVNRKQQALRALLDETPPPPPGRTLGRVVWRRNDTDDGWAEDDLAA